MAYLRDMLRVRDALFPPGGQMGYAIAIQPPSGQKIEMTVDGLTIKAAGASQTANPKWPSASGQDTGVKVQLDQGGQLSLLKSYDGPWGIFKMAAEGVGGGAQYLFNWNGARVTLQPS